MASMATTSFPMPTMINVYRDDWGLHETIDDMIENFHSDPSDISQVHRARRVVQKITKLVDTIIPFTVVPMLVDTQRGLGPFFSRLPGEIRNAIYSYLLSTGHPQFLAASKAVHVEANGLVAQEGIYRTSFCLPDSINYPLPSQRIIDTIRNLDIRFSLGYFTAGPWLTEGRPDVWLLQAFGEPGKVRGRCSVTLEVHPSTDETLLASFCMPLRLFSDFETVVVRAEIEWMEPTSRSIFPLESLIMEASAAWFKQSKTNPVPWSVFKFQYLYDHLHLTCNFGKARLEQDKSGLWLVFHPRKALEGWEE